MRKLAVERDNTLTGLVREYLEKLAANLVGGPGGGGRDIPASRWRIPSPMQIHGRVGDSPAGNGGSGARRVADFLDDAPSQFQGRDTFGLIGFARSVQIAKDYRVIREIGSVQKKWSKSRIYGGALAAEFIQVMS